MTDSSLFALITLPIFEDTLVAFVPQIVPSLISSLHAKYYICSIKFIVVILYNAESFV